MARRAHARRIVEAIRPHISIPDDQNLEAFGPVKATDRDSGGCPIRRHVTVLLHWKNGEWSFIRQVDRVKNGHVWNAPPFVVKTTEAEAQAWLKQHRLIAKPVHK